MDLFLIEIKYRPLISSINQKFEWFDTQNKKTNKKHCPYCFLHLKITKNVIIGFTTPVYVYWAKSLFVILAHCNCH